ncbi:MAG: SulP family inorganic anion transporter [Burkholderiales bacterium]|nr:SulP family inorganic anion transporter [Burkholderiales bacterium]
MRVKLLQGMRPWRGVAAGRDIVAGFSLAAVNVPQVLGYARIAGMPPLCGLHTLLLPLIAFALFGSSRHLVVAADSATAAILQGSVSVFAEPGSARYVTLVGLVALLTAGLLLLARLFRLGFLADFLSRTVLIGFLTGVGIQVAITMLPDMLNVAVGSANTLAQLVALGEQLPQLHAPTLVLSVLVVLLVMAGNRWVPRVPMALLSVVASLAVSVAFDLATRGFAVLGELGGAVLWPRWTEIGRDELLAMMPVALSCCAVIMAQSAATAREFALRHREAWDGNADLLGLSAANAAAAVSGAFVVNGSPTQTAMGERSGAGSQFAQIVVAGIVLVLIVLASDVLRYLPRAVLAAIVFTIAMGMIDVRALRAIRRESPGEFALALITAATVVTLGVGHGLLLAMTLSLLRHVRQSYLPHTMIYTPDAEGVWVPTAATPGRVTAPGLLVYRFGADLFYANVGRFVDELRALVAQAPTPLRHLVIDAAAITAIDYSAARAINELLRELAAAGIEVHFGRVNAYLRADMERHGLVAVLGAGRIAPTLHEALAACGVPAPHAWA